MHTRSGNHINGGTQTHITVIPPCIPGVRGRCQPSLDAQLARIIFIQFNQTFVTKIVPSHFLCSFGRNFLTLSVGVMYLCKLMHCQNLCMTDYTKNTVTLAAHARRGLLKIILILCRRHHVRMAQRCCFRYCVGEELELR